MIISLKISSLKLTKYIAYTGNHFPLDRECFQPVLPLPMSIPMAAIPIVSKKTQTMRNIILCYSIWRSQMVLILNISIRRNLINNLIICPCGLITCDNSKISPLLSLGEPHPTQGRCDTAKITKMSSNFGLHLRWLSTTALK